MKAKFVFFFLLSLVLFGNAHSSEQRRTSAIGNVHCQMENIVDAGLIIRIHDRSVVHKDFVAEVSEDTIAGPRFIANKNVRFELFEEGNDEKVAIFKGSDFYLKILVPADKTEVHRASFSGKFVGAYYEEGDYHDLDLACLIKG